MRKPGYGLRVRLSEMRIQGAALAAASLVLAATAAAQSRVLDEFHSVAAWQAVTSPGVTLAISHEGDGAAAAMRLDFDFHGGAGYAIARRVLNIELPPNYAFSFRIRGDAPANTLEFKLVDPSGGNVWWLQRRDFKFPHEPQTITVKKRHLSFAWGPAGGGEMRRVAALELAVSAGTGGKGTVWIEYLAFTPLPPPHAYNGRPVLSASSAMPGHGPELALDGNPERSWHSDERAVAAELSVDFQEAREFGGFVIDWDGEDYARRFRLELSDDGRVWTTARSITRTRGGRSFIPTPEAEARFARLLMEDASHDRGFGIREIAIEPLKFSASSNAFFAALARAAPRGVYPRYFDNEQVFWTVVGAGGQGETALLSEDGALEIGKGTGSVEPFLFMDGKLITWNEVTRSCSLRDGDLPIPTVTWSTPAVSLEVTAFAEEAEGGATLVARYRLHNLTNAAKAMRLFLAVRPFQVTPPWQFLNNPGGVTAIHELVWDGQAVRIDAERSVIPIQRPAGFGAARFDDGGTVELLAGGDLPQAVAVSDPEGYASGALRYDFVVAAGRFAEAALTVALARARAPLTAASQTAAGLNGKAAGEAVEARLNAVAQRWRGLVDRVSLKLPAAGQELVRTLRSNLAYILINRDGPAIQPGARTYARAWMRDGALISTALLRLGHAEEVRRFIDWYARYQFPDGKVPCCVDGRGADPVPENDSHGEFIFLVAEYARLTRDRTLASATWPHVEAAVAALDALRQQRRTPFYEAPERRAFYGLLPESISHEGYSAKPMHSYWDDLWALKGLEDAAALATMLGKGERATRFAAIAEEFRRDLLASLSRTMADHRIDYLPGCAELGDFDATSTTIALAPIDATAFLPAPALRRTFEKYWENFVRRRDTSSWENYTPYELRVVGSLVRLGWPERAHEALEFFLRDRYPLGWNAWAEVVWRDPATPKFIGDLPHTWVGADFIRSFLDLLAYERASDRSLVVAAGIPTAWVRSGEGVGIAGLSTYYGHLSYTLREHRGVVHFTLGRGIEVPPGGIVLRAPLLGASSRVSVNGEPAAVNAAGEVVIRACPAEVVIR